MRPLIFVVGYQFVNYRFTTKLPGMDALKHMFDTAFYRRFADTFSKVDRHFDADGFYAGVTAGLAKRSLNERLRNTTLVLARYLSPDFTEAVPVLCNAAPLLDRGYTALVLPDFIALYGKQHFMLSMEALKYLTVFGSSEFAVREFLKADLKASLRIMNGWAKDKDPHVRRLASEGSRPRLPWAGKLDAIIAAPELTRPILEQLKADEELYVRKSVANHLNDISKENTAYMLELVGQWDCTHPYTAWIVKHACRTLIKKGHPDALALFNFERRPKVALQKLKFNALKIRIGDSLRFSFDLLSEKRSAQQLVVDYAVHYPKKSGSVFRKVFKLRELILPSGGRISLARSHSFKDLSTRKHVPGKYRLEIQVNGMVLGEKTFRVD